MNDCRKKIELTLLISFFLLLKGVSCLTGSSSVAEAADESKNQTNSAKVQVGSFQNNCVQDVEKQFEQLPTEGTKLCIGANCEFDQDTYTMELVNRLGFNNHFQGIARKGRHLFISGGDPHSARADLFIAKIGTQPKANAPLCSNFEVDEESGDEKFNKEKDKIIKRFDILNGKNWHAGGVAMSGNLLAIPVEEWIEYYGYSSTILFFDVSNPKAPKKLDHITVERAHRDAGKTFIHQLSNGRILLGVKAKFKELKGGSGIDFYLSKGQDINDGFIKDRVYSLPSEENNKIDYGQGMGMIEDCDSHKLYLITFNNQPLIPLMGYGDNVANLYHLDFDRGYDHSPKVNFISKKVFGQSNAWSYGNFAAATGIEVTEDHKLSILSANYYRHLASDQSYVVRLQEYRADTDK